MFDSVNQKNSALNDFLAALKSIRKEKGLDQAQVAELAGMNPQTLSAINRSKRTPGLDTAERVSEALGYPLGDFLALGRSLTEGETPAPINPAWLEDLLPELRSLDENGQKAVKAAVEAFKKP